MHSAFSIRESLRFGWRTTRAESGLIFKCLLTLFAVEIAYSIVVRVLGGTLSGFAAAPILAILGILLGIGFTRITLLLARGEHPIYSDLLPPLHLAWQFIAASFLVFIIILIGFILLIVPGIYFLLRYFMVRLTVLEGAGISGSLRKSAQLTRGVKWRLLGFLLILILLNILGALCLLVGLLISVPVTMLAYAHVYTELQHRTG